MKGGQIEKFDQPCEGCLFWYGFNQFGSDWHCEILTTKPKGHCNRVLYPLIRELRGFPSIRVEASEMKISLKLMED